MRRALFILTIILSLIFGVLTALRFLLAALFPSAMVAYMSLPDGLPEIIVHDLSHNLKLRLDHYDYVEPAISPDGRRLALTQLLSYGSDIMVYDIASAGSRRLTGSNAIAESPAWSPDGEWIAFHSNREGDSNIYVIRPDGSDLRRITASEASERQPAWSPDGESIAFASNRDDGWDIYTYHLRSAFLTQLTTHPNPDNSPDWSPDGKTIVFASRRDGASAIYLYSLETGQVTPLVVEFRYDSLPKWTPDGRAVTFARSVDGVSRIMHVDVETGELTRAATGRARCRFAQLVATIETPPRHSPIGATKTIGPQRSAASVYSRFERANDGGSVWRISVMWIQSSECSSTR